MIKQQQPGKKTEIWKQASEVYAELSELSAQAALAHLYGIKNITADVRDAVITLINAGSQASQYFQDNINPHFNFNINNAQNFQPGLQLDEYQLLEELGHGGMSQVFKAKRINSEQQTLVAIKIFAPRDNSNELLNHFINEQKILAELSHPHIVKMLHGGMTDDKTAYLVMELLENAQALDAYSKNKNLNNRQKIHLIAQCADALAYSHANLIIHRDLKPDNILVNHNQQLKIVDFGIAKLINNDISGNKTTIMALTPSYAAPEQINAKQISVKTDIFSLAVVALDLLTKQRPLPKDRLLKSCANDEEHLDGILKSLSCDKDLKNILRKSLQQNPDLRYSSMQSFADDLNNWLNNKPVNATSQSFFYRLQKFAHRRSALFASLLSFFVFLILGSILGYQQYKQIKIEAQKAEFVKQFMLDSFEVTDPDNTQGTDISAKDLLKLATDKLEKNTNIDLPTKFDLLQTLGLAHGKLGYYSKAIDLLRQSLLINNDNSKSTAYLAQYLLHSERNEELNTLLEKISLDSYESYLDKARIYRIQAKKHALDSEFEKAHEVLNKAIALNIPHNDPLEEITSKRLLAELYFYQSQPQDGIKILTTLLANTTLANSNTTIMALRSDLASLYDEIGNSEQAIIERLKVIDQQRIILGNNHPELAISLSELSVAYKHMGEIQKAQSSIDEAYQISLDLYGANNLITANILNSRALLLDVDGKTPQAIELIFEVLRIFKAQKSENNIDALIMKTNLAMLLSRVDRNIEAYDLVKQVYDYQILNLGQSHYDTLYSQQILARTLVDLDRIDEAVELAELAVKNAQIHLAESSNNHILAGTYYTLGKIYQSNKQYSLAIENFLNITEQKLINSSDVKYAILLFSIAKLYEEIEDFAGAEKFYIDSINKHINVFTASHKRSLMVQIRYAKLLKSYNKAATLQTLLKSLNSIINDSNIQDEAVLIAFKELNKI